MQHADGRFWVYDEAANAWNFERVSGTLTNLTSNGVDFSYSDYTARHPSTTLGVVSPSNPHLILFGQDGGPDNPARPGAGSDRRGPGPGGVRGPGHLDRRRPGPPPVGPVRGRLGGPGPGPRLADLQLPDRRQRQVLEDRPLRPDRRAGGVGLVDDPAPARPDPPAGQPGAGLRPGGGGHGQRHPRPRAHLHALGGGALRALGGDGPGGHRSGGGDPAHRAGDPARRPLRPQLRAPALARAALPGPEVLRPGHQARARRGRRRQQGGGHPQPAQVGLLRPRRHLDLRRGLEPGGGGGGLRPGGPGHGQRLRRGDPGLEDLLRGQRHQRPRAPVRPLGAVHHGRHPGGHLRPAGGHLRRPAGDPARHRDRPQRRRTGRAAGLRGHQPRRDPEAGLRPERRPGGLRPVVHRDREHPGPGRGPAPLQRQRPEPRRHPAPDRGRPRVHGYAGLPRQRRRAGRSEGRVAAIRSRPPALSRAVFATVWRADAQSTTTS